MTPDDLIAWEKELGFELPADAAKALKLSYSAYMNYRRGYRYIRGGTQAVVIPGTIGLACMAVLDGHTEFNLKA